MVIRTFNFDGDFVRRAEFIPKENLAEVKKRLLSFNDVDIQIGSKEYDFRPFAVSLENKNISYEDIILSVENFLQPYDKVVVSENFSEEDEKEENEMFAFGDKDIVLWGGRESLLSDKITWLEIIKPSSLIQKRDVDKDSFFNNLSQVIFSFGFKNDLLLVDLDARKIIDCSVLNEIVDYFCNW